MKQDEKRKGKGRKGQWRKEKCTVEEGETYGGGRRNERGSKEKRAEDGG